MNYNLKIQKTDVKVFDISVEIDFADLKSWVDSNMDTYKQFLEEQYFDDEKGRVKTEDEMHEYETWVTEEDYYNGFVDDYVEDLDLDRLWLDNCHDHSDYQMENEECQLMEISLA